ncbi:MAG: hypothetical protein ACJAX1_003005 [Neolewinella sp.]|jgi:hypothetical protein
MSSRPDLLPALLGLFNFVLVVITATLLYLLFGPNLIDTYRNQPVAMEQNAYRPGSGDNTTEIGQDKVVDGIHLQTGLIYAEGFNIVRGTCTACHSAKLVTQNRATREGWMEMIRWMQAKQGLWDLGDNEPIILSYLAANYAPQETGRRSNLQVDEIEWYILEMN